VTCSNANKSLRETDTTKAQLTCDGNNTWLFYGFGMAEKTRNRKYEVYDFVSTPIGLPAGAGLSMGEAVASRPAIPSFYGGPDRQQETAPQPAPILRRDVPAGWYPDPASRHQQRFWDGHVWTCNVADSGIQGVDAGPPAA